jgi:hypothetical protein
MVGIKFTTKFKFLMLLSDFTQPFHTMNKEILYKDKDFFYNPFCKDKLPNKKLFSKFKNLYRFQLLVK